MGGKRSSRHPAVFNKQLENGLAGVVTEENSAGSRELLTPGPTRSQHQYQNDVADGLDALSNINLDAHLHLAFHWLPFGMPRGHGTLIPLTTYYAPLLARLLAYRE